MKNSSGLYTNSFDCNFKVNPIRFILFLKFLIICTFSYAQQNVSYINFKTLNDINNNIINTSFSVGSTEGSAGVSNGAAIYNIPIISAPRPSGTIPIHDLSVVYSSNNWDGPAGRGWSISGGGSVISRSHKTIAFDNITESNCTSNEIFNIDGVKIYRDETYATIGSQTEKWYVENESFSEILSFRNNSGKISRWKVTTKDGLIMEYGVNNSSVVSAQNLTSNNTSCNLSTSENIFFYLDNIIYPNGNIRTFTYTNFDTHSKTIESIWDAYGGHEFNYKLRQDINKSYPNGKEAKSDLLLDNIIVYNSDMNIVRRYNFRYSTDNVNSYLSEIQEENADGIKLNPTIFKYGSSCANELVQTDDVNYSFQKTPGLSYDFIPGDFNNDGLSDILMLQKEYESSIGVFKTKGLKVFTAQSNNYNNTYSFNKTYEKNYLTGGEIRLAKFLNDYSVSDYNGDGLEDFIQYNVTYNNGKLYHNGLTIYVSNGDGTFTENFRPPFNNECPIGKYIQAEGDFDGDGGTDYILITHDGSVEQNYISYPKKNIYNQLLTRTWGTSLILAYQSISGTKNYLGALDFDGDGKDEIILNANYSAAGISNYSTILSIDNNIISKKTFFESFLQPATTDKIYFGDFNGDGKTDLVKTYLNESLVRINYSTGNTFIESTLNLDATTNATSKFHITDFNNDGKADILFNNSLYFSTGVGFYKKVYSINLLNGEYSLGDFNGDGNIDIYSTSTNSTATVPYTPQHRINSFFNGCEKNLLWDVKDGLGGKTTFVYDNMSNSTSSSIYSKSYTGSSFSTNPLKYKNTFYIQKPMFLVKSVSSETSEGLNYKNYKYKGALFNKEGRGFLGFRQIDMIDLMKNVSTSFHTNTQQFSQFDELLIVDKSETYNLSNNQLISQVNTLYSKSVLSPKHFYIRKNQVDVYDYLRGNTRANYTYQYLTGELLSETTVNLLNNNTVTKTFGYSTPNGTNLGKRPALPTSISLNYSRTSKPNIVYNTNFEYNALGQLTKEIKFPNTPKSVTTEFTYYSNGIAATTKVTGAGMPSKQTQLYIDQTARFITGEVDPLGRVTNYSINPMFNKPNSITGIDGLTTEFEYDAWGRKTKTSLPRYNSSSLNEVTVDYEWDFGLKGYYYSAFKETTKGTNAKTTVKYFDRGGRLIAEDKQIFNGQFITEQILYGSNNLIANSTFKDYLGNTISDLHYDYDDFDRLISYSKFPACSTVNTVSYPTTYTKSGDFWEITSSIPSSETNPNGKTTYQKVTLDGELIESSENGLNTMQYEYDAEGKNTKVLSNSTLLTEIKYDDFGKQKELTDNSGGIYTYEYNSLGDITRENYPNGYKIINYDLIGRKIEERLNEGTIQYTYFPNNSGVKTGKVKKISGYIVGNSEEFDYDILGRVNKITKTIAGRPGSLPFITQFNYNDQGKLSSKISPTGNSYIYNYNNYGFLQSISRAGTTIYSVSAVENTGSLKEYFIGTEKVINHYDACNFLTRIESPSFDESYDWDKINSNLISKTKNPNNEIIKYEYDNFERLTLEDYQTYGYQDNVEYNNNGNIEWKGSAGEYLYHTEKQFAVKNIISAAQGSDGFSKDKQEIYYTSFSKPHTVIQGLNKLIYSYDNNFERIKSTEWANGIVTNRKFYVGNSEFNYDANNIEKSKLDYIYANGAIVAIDVQLPNKPSKLWYTFTDYQGSIRVVRDQPFTQGCGLNYSAWGAPSTINGVHFYNQKPSSIPFDWLSVGYTGQEHLYDFGLINLNARLYDPHNSRMLSPDNLVTSNSLQGFNRYAYAHNNPNKYIDPDGNDPVTVTVVVAAIVIGGAANVYSNWDNIKDFYSGLSYFGVGASSGVTTLFAGPVAGGIVSGIGNNVTTTIVKGKSFDYGEMASDAIISGVVSGATANLGDKISPVLDDVVSKVVNNPIVTKAVSRAVAGLGVGTLGGGAGAALNGGSFSDIISASIDGGKLGVVLGLAQGTIEGLADYRTSRSTSKTEASNNQSNDNPVNSSENDYPKLSSNGEQINGPVTEFTYDAKNASKNWEQGRPVEVKTNITQSEIQTNLGSDFEVTKITKPDGSTMGIMKVNGRTYVFRESPKNGNTVDINLGNKRVYKLRTP